MDNPPPKRRYTVNATFECDDRRHLAQQLSQLAETELHDSFSTPAPSINLATGGRGSYSTAENEGWLAGDEYVEALMSWARAGRAGKSV